MLTHDAPEHAGNLSFLMLLSIFPSVFLVISILDYFTDSFGSVAVLEFINKMEYIMPSFIVGNEVHKRVIEIVSGPPSSLLSLAIIGSIWISSSFIEGMRATLNKAYRVSCPPAYFLRRALSILHFLVLVLFFIVAVGLMTVFAFMTSTFMQYGVLFKVFKYLFLSIIMITGISFLYTILPNTKQSFLRVFPGAILVLILWTLSGILFSCYISHFGQFDIIYGSLGKGVASLTFFYICSLCVIYGAEFNFIFYKNLERSCKDKF